MAAGERVAGIDVASVADSAVWGPFTIERQAITFAPFEVGGFEVGGRVVPASASIEEVAAAFSGCEEHAVRGGRVLRCPGVTITTSGATSPENVRIRIEAAGYSPSDPTTSE